MAEEFIWTDEKIVSFISQYDMLRGYHKEFDTLNKLRFFKENSSLVRSSEPKAINIPKEKIAQAISFYYGKPISYLTAKGRKNIIKYKQIYQYFLKNLTKMKLIDISEHCGYSTYASGHSTVIYNSNAVQFRYEVEPSFRREIDEIKEIIMR